MRARGRLARLGALEDTARERAAVEAVKAEQVGRALDRLSEEDLGTLYAHLDALEAGGEAWAQVLHAARALEDPPSRHPARIDAEAWLSDLDAAPDGTPWPVPADPSSFAGYFEEEAGRCADLLARVLGGEDLPDGVTREAAEAVARYALAGWRQDAALCRVLGGEA